MAAGAVIKSLFDLLVSVEARWLRLLAARTPASDSSLLTTGSTRLVKRVSPACACCCRLTAVGRHRTLFTWTSRAPGFRSKQCEARRARKTIRVSRSLAASPPMICVLPQVLWLFSAPFNAGGWKRYRVKSVLFYLSVFWRPCPHVAPMGYNTMLS